MLHIFGSGTIMKPQKNQWSRAPLVLLCILTNYADNTLRPLRRRLASTRRPFLVDIR